MGAKPLTKDEIKSIQTEWLSGKSIIKIATELGRGRGTISNHINTNKAYSQSLKLIEKSSLKNILSLELPTMI